MSDQEGKLRSTLRARLVEQANVMLAVGKVDWSLRELARGLGVSAMAPYRHFSSKADLLAAVAEAGFGDLLDALRRADSREDALEALIAQGVAYIEFARARPHLFRLMFGPLPPSRGQACGGQGDSARLATQAMLRARLVALLPETGDSKAGEERLACAVLACWGLVHGLALLGLDGVAGAPVVATEKVLEMFLQGLSVANLPHNHLSAGAKPS